MDELHSTQDNSEVCCWEGTCHNGLGQTCRGLSCVCIMYYSLFTLKCLHWQPWCIPSYPC